MKRRLMRAVTTIAALSCLVAALIYSGLAAYCLADVIGFYAGAVELPGTITEVKSFVGGPAPLVAFVDPKGVRHEHQFNSLYTTWPDDVGERRTVLYNPSHHHQLALASPWNWIGSIVYGVVTIVFASAAGGLYFLTPRPATSAPEAGHGS
jgi:hypothetical protein